MSALDTQVGGSHYSHGKIQPVQYIEANKLQFLEGCVVKRVTRHDKPGGKGKQDIEKAIHELQLLLEQRYPVDALPGDHPQPVYEDDERAVWNAAKNQEYRARLDAAKVAESDADGWIAWGGGECPVPEGSLVWVRCLNGKGSTHAEDASQLEWSFDQNCGWKIVAYRLDEDEPQWPMVSEPGDHSKITAAYKPGMEWRVDEDKDGLWDGAWGGTSCSPSWLKNCYYAIRPAQGAQA